MADLNEAVGQPRPGFLPSRGDTRLETRLVPPSTISTKLFPARTMGLNYLQSPPRAGLHSARGRLERPKDL